MRIIILLLCSYVLSGCSSLQRYHAFRLDAGADNKSSDVVSSCDANKKEDETITLKFDSENELKLRFGLMSSRFWLMGPPLIPFVPSWHDYQHDLVGLDIIASPGIELKKDNWKIITPSGENSASKIAYDPNMNCDPKVTTGEFMELAANDQLAARCQKSQMRTVLIRVPKNEIPDTVTLVIEGVVIRNKIQPTKKLLFTRSSFLSYGAYGAANERLYGQTPSCK